MVTVLIFGFFEVAGLGTLEAREAGNRFLDSIRMDASGLIRPGDKKR